jgi:hypothetical protein
MKPLSTLPRLAACGALVLAVSSCASFSKKEEPFGLSGSSSMLYHDGGITMEMVQRCERDARRRFRASKKEGDPSRPVRFWTQEYSIQDAALVVSIPKPGDKDGLRAENYLYDIEAGTFKQSHSHYCVRNAKQILALCRE